MFIFFSLVFSSCRKNSHTQEKEKEKENKKEFFLCLILRQRLQMY